jgi:membrane protease YdiL (CAAX protease family)
MTFGGDKPSSGGPTAAPAKNLYSEHTMKNINKMKNTNKMKNIVNWKAFAILSAACAVTSVLVIPFQVGLSPALADLGATLYLAAFMQGAVIFSVASFFGLMLAPKVGFSLLAIDGAFKWSKLAAIVKPSVIWGALGGVLIIVLALPFGEVSVDLLKSEMAVPAWAGFLACFYGGIAEEVLMRFFAMSLIAWILLKIKLPRTIGIWAAIAVSAVLFGLGHLPITGELTAITAEVVARAILLNGTGAVVFSVLYWKKGLASAMIAHFSADVVLHVIAPLAARLFISA